MTRQTGWLRLAAASLLAAATTAHAAISVQVLEEGPRVTTLRISVGTPQLLNVKTDAGEFQRFTLESSGMVRGGNAFLSQPELPLAGFPLALPIDLKEDAQVSVQPEGTVRTMNARLFPVQPEESTNSERRTPPKFVFDPALYLKGGSKPGDAVDRTVLARGDVNVESLRFSPFGYEPGNGLLTWHDSYIITIQHAAGGCFVTDHLANESTRKAFDAVDTVVERLTPPPALRYVINQKQLVRVCGPLVVSPLLSGARFIIVTHPNFLAAANTLATHKRARGISTAVVTTQQINGGPFATATAPQIRAWLKDFHNTRVIKPRWLLLLGDSEFLPTHYDQQNMYDPVRNAGDIWYGQYGTNGQPDGPATMTPVVGIGRFPVDTLAQANAVVNKVIAFENNPPPGALVGQDFYSRLTFASYFESSGTTDTRWFVETTEKIRNHIVPKGYAVERIYIAPGSSNPTTYRSGLPVPAALRKPGFAWNGNAAQLINAFNLGSALVYHRDHGSWNGWGDPSFTTGNLGSVSVPGTAHPVIFSINCASGVFDNETVDLAANTLGFPYGTSPASTYWAEAFLRKADGALAVIGDTRDSSTRDNSHLALGLFDALFPGLAPGFGAGTPVRRLGDLMNHGRAFLSAVHAGTTANLHPTDNGAPVPVENLRQQLNIYNLLGDPTVELRLSPPSPIVDVFVRQVLDAAIVRATLKPCERCLPEEVNRFVPVVAFDPESGREIGRSVLDDTGNASIPLNGYRGKLWFRLSGTDGATTQAALDETDTDGDGIPDSRDNCTDTANANQRDSDGDGYGDVCDADVNNDGIVNSIDVSIVRNAFGARGANRADINGDGIVNTLDASALRRLFATRPGPSAWVR